MEKLENDGAIWLELTSTEVLFDTRMLVNGKLCACIEERIINGRVKLYGLARRVRSSHAWRQWSQSNVRVGDEPL